jgi:hypothetical protein
MAITNHERVGKAMDLLKAGLTPFVEREFKNLYKGQALVEAQRFIASERLDANRPFTAWDVAVLLRLMWEAWNDVFRKTLGQAERSLVSELRHVRNRWAHQEPFSGDDADRALDSAERLLTAVSASQADDVRKVKMELRRTIFDEQARSERCRGASTAIESAAAGNLKPWREVVTPHRDVASGRYQQAEFAGSCTCSVRVIPSPANQVQSPHFTTCVRGLCHGITPRFLPADVPGTPLALRHAACCLAKRVYRRGAEALHASAATAQALQRLEAISWPHP